MTYAEFIAWLNQLYQAPMRLGLKEIQNVLTSLGQPQDQVKTIHVVGTNGKGSVSATLASVYTQAGYKTGLFISPHLQDIRERIQINGQPVSEESFLKAGQVVLEVGEDLTYFTLINAMAFWLFREENVDIAIIEAGLGGRLDSTNVMTRAEAIVVTPISYDHTRILGPTLTHIATEKAGVFKPGVPVITCEQPEEVMQVLKQKTSLIQTSSETVQVENIIIDNHHPYRELKVNGHAYRFNLLGRYQSQNVSLVFKILETLQSVLPVSQQAVESGLRHVYWPGRFQYFYDRQLIIDGSHNEAGFKTLLETLSTDFGNMDIHFGISLLKSRDVVLISSLMHYEKTAAVTCFPGLSSKQFHERESYGDVEWVESVETFLRQSSSSNMLKVVTGSLYTAGQALNYLNRSE